MADDWGVRQANGGWRWWCDCCQLAGNALTDEGQARSDLAAHVADQRAYGGFKGFDHGHRWRAEGVNFDGRMG